MSERTGTETDWATQIVDTLENVVDTVRSKTTQPVQTIVRFAIYGLMAFGIAIAALLLLTIGMVRLLDIVLPPGVWAAHLLLGVLFLAIGLFAWSRRNP